MFSPYVLSPPPGLIIPLSAGKEGKIIQGGVDGRDITSSSKYLGIYKVHNNTLFSFKFSLRHPESEVDDYSILILRYKLELFNRSRENIVFIANAAYV